MSSSVQALSLRSQALALLQQAQALDGLQPFLILHTHEYGTSGYIAWHTQEPSELEAIEILDTVFEPEREEFVSIQDEISLHELTGADVTHVIPAVPAATAISADNT